MKNCDKALADLDEVIRLDANDGASYLKRGLVWLEKEETARRWATSTRPFGSTENWHYVPQSGSNLGSYA